MKATGIVRRIDELGRVVIPKEIRRIMRLQEGDPLEIYMDRETNGIFLKKYSPLLEMSSIAQEHTDSLMEMLDCICCVCDKDMIVAVSGCRKKDLYNKPVTNEMGDFIKHRITIKNSGSTIIPITMKDDAKEYTEQVIVSIVADGEIIGALMLLNKDDKKNITETDIKMAELTAKTLGKQLEQ